MATRKISLTWEGELSDEALQACIADDVTAFELLAERSDVHLTIEQNGEIVHQYCFDDDFECEFDERKENE